VAERNNLWSRASGEKLDFLAVYGVQRSHPEYATRRVWRALSLLAPSLNLPAETDGYGSDYPFSVKAEKVVTPEVLMGIFRDHYEGKVCLCVFVGVFACVCVFVCLCVFMCVRVYL